METSIIEKQIVALIKRGYYTNRAEFVEDAKFVKRIKEDLYFEEIEKEKFIFVASLSQKELQYAHKLKTEYGLSIADSECIAIAKMRREILLF